MMRNTNSKCLVVCLTLFVGLSACASARKPADTKPVVAKKVTPFAYPTVAAEEYPAEQIREELDAWFKQMMAIHPKLDVSVDFETLFRTKSEIRKQITAPMNQLEVYRLFSQLNSVLSDAHHGIALPDLKEKIDTATKAGDRLFPVPVHINEDYELMAKDTYDGIKAGTKIQNINGVPATEITKFLERHARGDNPAFRRTFVADRFAELFWIHYGSAKVFELDIKQESGLTAVTGDGASELPPHRRGNRSFEDLISFELLSGDQVGYFRVDTFHIPDLANSTDKWFDFTESVFKELKEKGSQHLIIDIRENGGGDDTLWIEGIMPYIAGKTWQRMLHFLGRVRPTDDAYPGRVGEVAIFDYLGEYETSKDPQFEGQVYVITGRKTYSSAIMFASAIRDNGLAKIVGTMTDARGCQTGMFVMHEMKTSGLDAFTPQHWYQRNTEDSCMEGVAADIELLDNPFDKQEIVEALISQIIVQ